MGKRMILVVVMFVVALMLCACASTERWPRVCIEPTGFFSDCIYIPLRGGYRFAEDAYDIVEAEAGYDIVIHAEATIKDLTQREATPWR